MRDLLAERGLECHVCALGRHGDEEPTVDGEAAIDGDAAVNDVAGADWEAAVDGEQPLALAAICGV